MRFKLVLAIGNPGAEYLHTYHNAGVMAFEYWRSRSDAASIPLTNRPTFSYIRYQNLIGCISRVFMNTSGVAARDCASFFHIEPNHLLVVHDDSDLTVGQFRLCFDRGAGGHHGIESIIQHIGTSAFWRFRIGIRPSLTPDGIPLPHLPAGSFVLSPIPHHDRTALTSVFDQFSDCIDTEIVHETP
ncbi:MAG: hypothetical protein RIQ54_161 [Candidatus Parcubacteria bacterium]|jgi:PTH1 family peptidyl-tRNA hydrolase